MRTIIESILTNHNQTILPGGGLDTPRELEQCRNTLTLIEYLCIVDSGGNLSELGIDDFEIPYKNKEIFDDNLLILYICLEYSITITDARAILNEWQHTETKHKRWKNFTYYAANRLMGINYGLS